MKVSSNFIIEDICTIEAEIIARGFHDERLRHLPGLWLELEIDKPFICLLSVIRAESTYRALCLRGGGRDGGRGEGRASQRSTCAKSSTAILNHKLSTENPLKIL
jgi:hypothetical protein